VLQFVLHHEKTFSDRGSGFMKIFLSILFGILFIFLLILIFEFLGLEVSVKIFNSDPTMYEDDEAFSGIYVSTCVLSIIAARYSYLAMEQSSLKIKYGLVEKDGTKAWIKSALLFSVLTTPFDIYTDYYIGSSGENFLSHFWYILSVLICWYFFGRKYFNPLSHWKLFR